jgi:hypothetical protein
MITTRVAALFALLSLGLRQRIEQLRAEPEHGGHAVEYAIGVAGSAVIILSIIAALKSGLGDVVKSWLFK